LTDEICWDSRYCGLTGGRALCVEGFFNPPAAGLHFLAFLQIITKLLVSLRAILKAPQIGFKFDRRFGGETVDHPGAVPCALDEAVLSQVSEMLGNLGLRKLKDLLKVADAQRPLGEQLNDTEASRIAETLINLDHPPMREVTIGPGCPDWTAAVYTAVSGVEPFLMSELLNDTVIASLRTAIRGFVSGRIRDHASADDITQDVLLKISTQ
jgi:hypothetical protein